MCSKALVLTKPQKEKKKTQSQPLPHLPPRFSSVLTRAVISVYGIQSLGKNEGKKTDLDI